MKPKLYPVNVPLVIDYEGLLTGIALQEAALLASKNKYETGILEKTCTYLKHIRNEVEHRYWAQIKEQRKKEVQNELQHKDI